MLSYSSPSVIVNALQDAGKHLRSTYRFGVLLELVEEFEMPEVNRFVGFSSKVYVNPASRAPLINSALDLMVENG